MKWIGCALFVAIAWAQDVGPGDALANAALRCDAIRVKAALEQGVSANTRDKYDVPVLNHAVGVTARRPECAAVVRILLDQGADVKLRDPAGETALLAALMGHASEHAIIGSSLPLVRLLLARGSEVNARDKDGWTPLTMLADQFAEQSAVMRLLLEHGAEVNAPGKGGPSALVYAARHGHADEVRLLLSHGANLNARDGSGRTALMEAAATEWDRESAVLKLLLARGVDRRATDSAGHDAAWFAASAGYPDRVRLLSGDRSALQISLDRGLLRMIEDGGEKGVEDLLGKGADPDAKDEVGTPALVLAAHKNYAPEPVKSLLDHGARVDEPDSDGKTALMVAAKGYAMKIVNMLLEKGAREDTRDRAGNTPLLSAVCASAFPDGMADLVSLLLAHGADVRAANSEGVTSVMLAAKCGNPALVELVEKGADVNASDMDGTTALMIASLKGGEAYVKFLLDKGADVRARDKAGRSVLLNAIDAPDRFDDNSQNKYTYNIASLLVMRGADINAASNTGDTPLIASKRRGYDDMVRLLIDWGVQR